MNRIEDAVALLENGWCVGDLVDPYDKDKHCAVGAMAAAAGHLNVTLNERNQWVVDEDETYRAFNSIPEGKALAQEVLASYWMVNHTNIHPSSAKYMLGSFEAELYDEVVFHFNDMQDDKEDVIEMFKHAAKRM